MTQYMRCHILPALGGKKMDAITTPDVSTLMMLMLKKKQLKNGSVNKMLKILRAAYYVAIKMKINGVKENPVVGIKQFPEEHMQRFLTKEETKRLFIALEEYEKSKYLKYAVKFLLLTGARVSEALSARWEEVDFIKKEWLIPETKSGKPRIIPIHKALEELLLSIPSYKRSEFLFPSKMSPNGHLTTIKRQWDRIRKKVGLEDVRIHDLRHSFASTLVNNGCNLYEVQKLLGHHDLKMTQRYAHLSDAALQSAASLSEKIFEP